MNIKNDIWSEKWSREFAALAHTIYQEDDDPSHDILHIERVVETCEHLALREHARRDVALPAAWLHDAVSVPKNSPDRSKASQLAAAQAITLLKKIAYPDEGRYAEIAHCIEAHSFSASIAAKTLEAKVVQDADRLDALGAIGIVRWAITGSRIGTQFIYNPEAPDPGHRGLQDSVYMLDHFGVKLYKIAETLHTPAAKEIGAQRYEYMRSFVTQLLGEINQGV